MPTRTKAILINASIAVGLVFEYVKGKPVAAILIAGAVLFAVANVVVAISVKKRNATNT
jgi:hypothetical protein